MHSPESSFNEQHKALTIEWEQAIQETQRVKRQFVTSGNLGQGGKIMWPERILDSQGLREISEAERVEKQKWDAMQAFNARYRPRLG